MNFTPKISIITSVYQGIAYLSGFCKNITALSNLAQCELILIMNKPTQPEIELVGNFYRLYPDQVRSIQVEPVEPLSASWYRGWKLARGKYIAEKNNAKVIEASENLGLTFSILSGISQVCEEHSRIIVLEDDLVLHPRTLDFMIQALDRYEDDPRVSHGSGFSFPIQHAPKVDAILLPLFNTPSSKIYFQNLLPNKVN